MRLSLAANGEEEEAEVERRSGGLVGFGKEEESLERNLMERSES
jgi:hypothetical protein